MLRILLLFLVFTISVDNLKAQHSVAREWVEVLLTSIRNDLARPTVHARNLHHVSAAMYDCWAAYDPVARPYFIGSNHNGMDIPFLGVPTTNNIDSAREIALSVAAYRIIMERFRFSDGFPEVREAANNLAIEQKLDLRSESTDYVNGGPVELGNYVAEQVLLFGKTDGSNEDLDYANLFYNSVNPPLAPALYEVNTNIDPNRWQPLSLSLFIDQSGNVIPFNTPPFLGPEWGNVYPFSLRERQKTTYDVNGDHYNVYFDPGPPPFLGEEFSDDSNEQYKWGFCLVSQWSSHLDTTADVIWDISPRSIGNVQDFPDDFADYPSFYPLEGGDPGTGYDMNPVTNLPYEPVMVPRSDFGRVVAEFWADGPDSETPPGHWFTLFNEVADDSLLVKKIGGVGPVVSDLEWDVKGYFILGGAMHDSAIAAWGIKGYYDYARPISALRYMAALGQSTDTMRASYHPEGITLIDDYIELIEEGDPLALEDSTVIGMIKVKAWKGPDYIEDPDTDAAGVDWILGTEWWPYQRPTFVTPNFAGYVSGHSTFSRAAAEIMTAYTGDPYFPGGYGEFVAKKNEFLVFEEGPSMDVKLQWATYRDASNQSSLSRIWGGIHPPADDIPGRLIGEQIGQHAYDFASAYFIGTTASEEVLSPSSLTIYPNPIKAQQDNQLIITSDMQPTVLSINDLAGKQLYYSRTINKMPGGYTVRTPSLSPGTYILTVQNNNKQASTILTIQ